MRLTKSLGHVLALAALLLAVSLPVQGSGFALYEHGAKSMGMAGAFAAQADDGSAMFFNVAGLGFIKDKQYMGGVTLITSTTADFDGLPPFPGSVSDEQESAIFVVPHAYLVRPVNDSWTFGVGINSPFGLATEWDDDWVGRFVSVRAELRVIDTNFALGWEVDDTFSLGISGIVRYSDVELVRHVGIINPFSQSLADVARVKLEGGFDEGYGWTAGLMWRPTSEFSLGVSYRSKIDVDYSGEGVFTQIPTGNPFFDGAVAASIPFGQDLPARTTINFPDQAFFAFGYHITSNFYVELDINWNGWSSFQDVRLDFPENPEFSSVIPENYDDAYKYMLGFRFDQGSHQWRFGVLLDETGQPEESVGPLLPDADRLGFTIGYGTQRFDIAYMYLLFDERTSLTNNDAFYGTYDTTAMLLAASVKFGGGH